MKRWWLPGLFLLMWNFVAAQVHWDGQAGDGLWGTAGNWTNNSVPLPSDDVILDHSFITGDYTVTLPSGSNNITIRSLIISPGASLHITLVLPSTNTSDPGLTVNGAGDGIILNMGSVLKNSSGATTGSGISITGTLRINNGGRYIHNTSRGNASIVSQLSTVAGTELGEFEFDTPTGSATISLSARHYGVLILSSLANGGTATYIGSGASPVNVHGDLVVGAGVTFSISMSSSFIIHRDWIQATTSVFNIQTSTNNNVVQVRRHLQIAGNVTETGTGNPRIDINGILPQNINVTGMIQNSVELSMSNSSGASLLSTLVIPYKLTLNNGKIHSSASHLLIISNNATVIGGSVNSFVSGPVKKIGDDAFVFPVGDGNVFAPISITNAGGELLSDEFIAAYYRQSPQSISLANFTLPIDHISYVEYWTLFRATGSASKLVGLKVGELSFARDPSSLVVSQWDGGIWLNEGVSSFTNGPAIGGYITGELKSNTVTNFSNGIFSIASLTSGSINPLPVKFTNFSAIRNNNVTDLAWEVADLPSAGTIFEIQRADHSSVFRTIHVLTASSARSHNAKDSVNGSFNYLYRIKVIESGSLYTYSEVRKVAGHGDQFRIFPNPVKDICKIVFNSTHTLSANVMIMNMNGVCLKKYSMPVRMGKNQIEIITGELPPAVYMVVIMSDTTQLRGQFLKQ